MTLLDAKLLGGNPVAGPFLLAGCLVVPGILY